MALKKKKVEKFIQAAIKRPGALTRRAEREGRTIPAQAKHDVAAGTTLEKRQANFYLNVLRKVRRRRKQGGKSLMNAAS